MKTFLAFAILVSVSPSLADICTPPKSSVDPTISVSVTFDKKAKTYTYRYQVSNGAGAPIPIESFAIGPSRSQKQVNLPDKWLQSSYSGSKNTSPTLWWHAMPQKSDAKPRPGEPPSDSLLHLAAAIAPGKSLKGFEIVSTSPPASAQYYVVGFTQLPKSTSTVNVEAVADCPGWDFESPVYDTFVTGLTVGPADPDITSVGLRLRDKTGHNDCGKIDPRQPRGQISVLVLSSSSFDAAQVDRSSLRFGPAKVQPLSSKLVASDGDRRASGDEREGWEREVDKLKGKPKPRSKDLLLTFDLASLDIQCGLDKAIFLRGTTTEGQNIFGGVSTKLTGCDVKKPGVRHPHTREEHRERH